MIELTYEKLLGLCGGFTVVCVAVGWLIKIIKAVKKPSDDVNTKLKNDDKRITELEEQMAMLAKSQPIILRTLFVICDELKRDNDVEGKISKQQEDINNYLLER